MPPAIVLVVDDEDATRSLLVDYLRERGLDAEGVRDGVEALHCLSTHCYKVVILDVMMPHMSGIDVLDSLEALGRDPSLQDIGKPPHVLVITAAPRETLNESELRQRSSCVRGLMHKPFDLGLLGDRVEHLISAA